MAEEIKVCTNCLRKLPASLFDKNQRLKSGLQSWCKECIREWVVAYRKTQEGKSVDEAYRQTDSCKEARGRYYRTDKNKARRTRADHNRRAILKISPPTLTAEEWEDLKKQYKYRCVYCGEKKSLTRDHIIPVAEGGPLTKENIIPACISCNCRKGTRPVLQRLLVTQGVC